MKLEVALFLVFSWGITLAQATLPEGANCSVGGNILSQRCDSGLQCVIYKIATLPDRASLGNCRKPNNNTCVSEGRYLAPNTSYPNPCGGCRCSATGGKLSCKTCVLGGDKCYVGGLLPNPPCQLGYRCELYDEGNIPADAPAEGICKLPNSDQCYDKARNLYFAPNATIGFSACGPCKCAEQGGQFECERCILDGGRCLIGGRRQPLSCLAGRHCILVDEGYVAADRPARGFCGRPTRNTCFDKERRWWFAPGTSVTNDCGPCKCPLQGGKFDCKKCILEGGNCTVGGRFVVAPPPCKRGLKCVLYDEGNIPADAPASGNCLAPNRNTCFDKERELWFAPSTPITNECGACKCAPTGGKFDCKKCILEGGNCTVGGFFAVPPPTCKDGLKCILYDEGNIPADAPAHGNCFAPDNNTCVDTSRGLYFFPRSRFTNNCGPCKCPSKGGRVSCKVTQAFCFVDPCMGKTCPKNPSAECVSNYCGGCKYAFYVNGKRVKC